MAIRTAGLACAAWAAWAAAAWAQTYFPPPPWDAAVAQTAQLSQTPPPSTAGASPAAPAYPVTPYPQTGAGPVAGAPPASAIPLPDQLPPPDESLLDEPRPWYRVWDLWGPPVELTSSFEAGINAATGNTETFSFRVGAALERRAANHRTSLKLVYAKTEAESVETQNYGQLDAGYEHLFGDSPWTWFAKYDLLYDEFKAFDVRIAVNGGVGYRLIDTDATTLTGRFGSGASREIGGPDDDWSPEAVFGLELSRALTRRQKLSVQVDYFPEWDDYEDYRLVTDAAWELLLDEPANLSLKLALTDRYDSTPHGLAPNDLIYSLLLLWKP